MKSPELYALLEELGESRFDGLARFSEHVTGVQSRPRRRRERLTLERIQEVHRHEVAQLLTSAAEANLAADPYWKGLLHEPVRDGETTNLPSRQQLRGDAEALRAACPDELRGLPEKAAEPRTSTIDLIQSSLSVVSRDSSWMLLALEYMRRKDLREARKALEQAMSRPTSSLHLAIAWQYVGILSIRANKLRDALSSYMRAIEADPGRPYSLAYGFLMAAVLGDRDSALRIGPQLEEVYDPSDGAVANAAHALLELRKRSILTTRFPSAADCAALARGPATEHLSHALAT